MLTPLSLGGDPWTLAARSPAPHTLPYLAFLDGVIVTHQITQGGHEFSDPSHALRGLFLPQADRLQHEAVLVQPECSVIIRTILRKQPGWMNYFGAQHLRFGVDRILE